MKLAVIFGSSSNEHEVSVVSAAAIIQNLNKDKYEIVPIYMDKENNFYVWKEDIKNIKPLEIGILPDKLEKIDNVIDYLKSCDLVFIMVHGKNGEDGILSSIFDFWNIKYIGNKARASMITMDKILTKMILEDNGIKTAPYLYFTKYNDRYIYEGDEYNLDELIEVIKNKFTYPLFVKPANSGSSIGVVKVLEEKSLKEALLEALKIDDRILVEEMILGKEVECGVLEKDKEVIASVVGEVKSAEEFYSFSAKYTNSASKTVIPADINPTIAENIQELAVKVFKVLGCHGYSRCDFFVSNDGTILLNEINTIPGFTTISMYPKLFEASGISYAEILDTIIKEASN